MTESSLHLIDYLFYVMDYNHVQSEVNLYFLKQIQDRGIPFYVIINQIDKHNESEIPFQTFIDSVKQTFNQWGVFPEQLFYSSLLDESHQLNQFQAIKKQLFSLFGPNKERIQTIEQATKQITSDHKAYLEENYEQRLLALAGDDLSEVDLSNVDNIRKKLKTKKQLPEQFKQEFQDALNQTLKNAYLMPASLREKATLFLEAQQKGFKVGLIGSKKKTKEERERHLDQFFNPLQKNIEATIQWNFRDKVIALLQQYQLTDPALIQSTKQLTIEYSADDLTHLIKPGAQINGSYVLNYTNDVATDIKNKYKINARTLLDRIQEEIIKQTEVSLRTYEQQLVDMENIAVQKRQQADLQQDFEEQLGIIDQRMEQANPKKTTMATMEQKLTEKAPIVKKVHVNTRQSSHKVQTSKREEKEKTKASQSGAEITKSIDRTISEIEG